jgi:valyl-tRNA synthetase
MLDREAKVTEIGGPYAGLDRFVCRKKIWTDMRAAGLVIKEEPYIVNVPHSQRGGEIVEPMISEQWFVKIEPLAKAALEAVRDGRIKIIPERFEKVYFNWLENIKDWCISRQLWWGHRIPVWYCNNCGKQTCTRTDPVQCAHCGSKNIRQDPDVLDTWFSSGLWPFSTLGWPEETPDYKYFYPTTMMETAYDILFFWVARMIMDGLEFTGRVPFETVYLHGLVRTDEGKKMSKSKGTGVDPLPVMEKYGTDALRFTLLVGSTPGNDSNISLKKVEGNRNFANKIWNAGRFVLSVINGQKISIADPTKRTHVDNMILARTYRLVRDVERLFGAYQYGEAGSQIYEFFWSEFADWYVEYAKNQIVKNESFTTAQVLAEVMDVSLRLLHPFMPFLTEELWDYLRNALLNSSLADMAKEWPPVIIIAPWPDPHPEEDWEREEIENFSLIQKNERAIRNLRAEKNVHPSLRIRNVGISGEWMTDYYKNVVTTSGTASGLDESNITFENNLPIEWSKEGIVIVNEPIVVHIPPEGLVDKDDAHTWLEKDKDEENKRHEKDLADVQVQIDRLEKLLGSDFAGRAPDAVVRKERERLAAFKETAGKIRSQLNG